MVRLASGTTLKTYFNDTFCSFDYCITEQNFTVLGLGHFYWKRQHWSISGKIDGMAENNIFDNTYLLWMI